MLPGKLKRKKKKMKHKKEVVDFFQKISKENEIDERLGIIRTLSKCPKCGKENYLGEKMIVEDPIMPDTIMYHRHCNE
jgi:hypothetical protein